MLQAAEKALKSACYTLDSKKINLSDLKLISSSLHDSSMSQLAKQLQDLIGPNDHLTHPGNTHFPKIPHELIEQERATQVQYDNNILLRVDGEYSLVPISITLSRIIVNLSIFIHFLISTHM